MNSIDPLNEYAWYNKGMMLCRLERHEEAVWPTERALKISPQNAHVWHNKGVALKRLEARFAFAAAG
jgi:Flp pilus assembly protein TadD